MSWEILGLTRVALLTGHTGDVREHAKKLVQQTKGNVQKEALLYAAVVGARLMDADLKL